MVDLATHRMARRHIARLRRRRADRTVAIAALIAAGLALPFVAAQPEAAGVLAIGAVALLAGQRWALGLVVVAALAVVRTSLPVALHAPLQGTGALAIATLLAATPALLAMRRGAAALALLAGQRTGPRCRAIWGGLCALALVGSTGAWF